MLSRVNIGQLSRKLAADAQAAWITLLTVHACLPTWRTRAKPFCSKSSTVALKRKVLVVFALVLDAREFPGAAVLAPALRGAILVDDQRGMRAAFLSAQDSSAACDSRRARSAGALIMGQ